ncbi:hypothetical protein Pmani_032422 [Petrolisthes manimaculis]|uniref:Uncharacterized protein n=1 Tax=Petrolisthes manimaculis TaxID=1843537 RepID=A0AAE1NTT8_9EUCA|nr:hypothetical protein Pmani_032422 [Petrolisthes manimaculis]
MTTRVYGDVDDDTVVRRRVEEAQWSHDCQSSDKEGHNRGKCNVGGVVVGATDDSGPYSDHRSQQREEIEESNEQGAAENVEEKDVNKQRTIDKLEGPNTKETQDDDAGKGPEFNTDTLSAPSGRQFLDFVFRKVVGKLLKAGYLVFIQGIVMLFTFILKIITKRG